MSMLTKLLGLDKPATTTPTTDTTPAVTTSSAIQVTESEVGKLIVAVDPNIESQIVTAVNNLLSSHGLSLTEAEVDALLEEELTKLGVLAGFSSFDR